MIQYSIVIPAYNSEDTLEICLQAVLAQDYPSDLYEVLVVDDGSTDNTARIASTLPVRLIQLDQNYGRIVARLRGVEAATYDQIAFVDTRVILPTDYLSSLAEIGYLPVIPHVISVGGPFNRVLSLFRARYYRGYYPLTIAQARSTPPVMLNADNWLRMPKGTTFACTKQQWLDAQPTDLSKYISDDTLILQNIQEQIPMLKAYGLVITYQQREEFINSLYHLYERGPRFLSYYLVAGGAYHRLASYSLLLLATLVAAGVAATILLGPVILAVSALLLLLALLGISILFSQRLSDVPLLLVMVPIVGLAFGAGLLRGAVIHRDKLIVRSDHGS